MKKNNRLLDAWKNWGGLALILIIAAGLRLQHIKADPPLLLPSISGSAGIYFDEGIYCHNARNKILFNSWITDEWNPIVYNAPLTLIYYAGFRLFGISIVTVKVINILFGLLSILFFQIAVRAYLPRRPTLALTAVFAVDYTGVMYNRLGLLENFSGLCFLASFALFVRTKNRRGLAFLLGVTVAAAVLSKYLFAYFLIAALLAVISEARQRSSRRFLLYFLAGGLTVGLPWFFGIYLPFRSTFSKISAGWGMLSWPRSVSQAWSNLIQHPLPRYLQLLPVAGFLLVLFGGLVLLKLMRPKAGRITPPDLFISFWIIGAVLSAGFLNYRPLRYYLPLLPAIYLAVSLIIKDRDRISAERLRFGLLSLIPALLFFPFFRSLVIKPSAFFVFPPGLRGLIYLALAGGVCYLICRKRLLKLIAEGLVLALLLGTSLFLYVRHFYQTPTYNLEAASRYLESLPAGSIIMGQEAPRLALGTRFKTIMAYENWFNDRDPFGRYKPTHLVVLNRFGGLELAWISRKFPDIAGRLRLIRTFRVWDTTLSLFEVPPP